MRECKDWLEEYGPAPIGWFYQIVNLGKTPRRRPEYTNLIGFDKDDNVVDTREVHVRHNNGRWYTPKMGKRDARALGAVWFIQEKVWPKED